MPSIDKHKIYLYFINGEYYGNEIEWEWTSKDKSFLDSYGDPLSDTLDPREHTIFMLQKHLDDIAEFIRPSVILGFIKTISDPNTGPALYDNLQTNVMSLINIGYKLLDAGNEVYYKFRDTVWGQYLAYSDENQCHICPFGRPEYLSYLLKSPEEFNKFFESQLRARAPEIHLALYDDHSLIDMYIAHYKEQIVRLKKAIKTSQAELDEYEKKLAELTKKSEARQQPKEEIIPNE